MCFRFQISVLKKHPFKKKRKMNEVSINKDKKLSQHFTLGELTKTSYHPLGGNIPSHVAIENLTRLCLWLELLRERYNRRYGDGVEEIPA